MVNENTPVFSVLVKGNKKDQLRDNPYALFLSHEAHINKTWLIIRTGVLNRPQQRQAIKELANELKRYGIHNAEIQYYRDGATIFQNSLN